VDTIIELRRFNGNDNDDRRRVLKAWGRDDETPGELVVELSRDGARFDAHGDRQQVNARDMRQAILLILPTQPPGLSCEAISERLADESVPRRGTLLKALKIGAERGDWRREGDGKRGSPWTYWVKND
jgi:hypothetical protein